MSTSAIKASVVRQISGYCSIRLLVNEPWCLVSHLCTWLRVRGLLAAGQVRWPQTPAVRAHAAGGLVHALLASCGGQAVCWAPQAPPWLPC